MDCVSVLVTAWLCYGAIKIVIIFIIIIIFFFIALGTSFPRAKKLMKRK